MKSWLRQHRFAIGAALGHMFKAPGSFLFNVLVVAIALTLPFAGLTLLENVRPMSQQLSVDPEISLFVTPATSREEAQAHPLNLLGLVQAHVQGPHPVIAQGRRQRFLRRQRRHGKRVVMAHGGASHMQLQGRQGRIRRHGIAPKV